MPDTNRYTQNRPPANRLPGRPTQRQQLVQARVANCITKNEYRQYRDWYLGLSFLNDHDNLITSQLWAGLYLPLGIKRRGEREEKIKP